MSVRSWTIEELNNSVCSSKNLSEVLRKMNLVSTGASQNRIRNVIKECGIDTSHFSKRRTRSDCCLENVLVENCDYNRNHLKDKLYSSGLKSRHCEICGQGEIWRNKRIALILDHINGNGRDNRLDNLRIVCPNCNAALPTHAGRNKRHRRASCTVCNKEIIGGQRVTCSNECENKAATRPRPEKRKTVRPEYNVLKKEVDELGFAAVGRKYGVTDNAIRKWIK